MTKAKAVIVGALVAASVGTTLYWQYQAKARLQAQIAAYRAQLAEREIPQPATAEGDQSERLREHEELIRLRGEVSALRRSAASTTPSSGAEKEPLKPANKPFTGGEAERGKLLLAKSPEIPMIPVTAWTNVGVANPVATLQTLNWAAATQDTNAFLNSIAWDPQARAHADELFAALPESVRQQYGSVDGVIIDWMLSHATPMAGFRVLSQSEQGADDMTLVEQHQYTDERVRENSVQFHRDENGAWRQIIPPELMPKLETVLGDLAGTPGTARTK